MVYARTAGAQIVPRPRGKAPEARGKERKRREAESRPTLATSQAKPSAVA